VLFCVPLFSFGFLSWRIDLKALHLGKATLFDSSFFFLLLLRGVFQTLQALQFYLYTSLCSITCNSQRLLSTIVKAVHFVKDCTRIHAPTTTTTTKRTFFLGIRDILLRVFCILAPLGVVLRLLDFSFVVSWHPELI
jgi:hypothetical protein